MLHINTYDCLCVRVVYYTEGASSDFTYIEFLSDFYKESDCIIEMDCYCENCPQKAKLGQYVCRFRKFDF